jgi:hypothetical protein
MYFSSVFISGENAIRMPGKCPIIAPGCPRSPHCLKIGIDENLR